MSSFLPNEIYKMLFKLPILVILLSTIKTGSATDLVDLPLSISSKSAEIQATLTDADGTNKYFIQESISASGAKIRGKIVISGEKDSYKIYYKTGPSLNKKRLVIHDKICIPFTYKNNWDETLPGINKRLTNLILLMGPSILYRLDHSSHVWPLPGIGCPYYLSTSETSGPNLPELRADDVHFTMYEYMKGSTTYRTFSEIYASRTTRLLRIKANLLGVSTETIYDYPLGVAYLFEEDGSCSILGADLNSPGISSYGFFNLARLFLADNAFRYLGKLNLERRSGFSVDAWELIEYNFTINGIKADKAIITQYFVESRDSEIFAGHTLVSTTVAIYKLDSSKKTYTLTDEITRDYMNFASVGFEDEFHDIFTLKECKDLSSAKTLTLGFILQRKDGNYSSKKLTESHIYELKQDFIYNFILPKKISPLRVDNIQYNLNDAQVEIEVTFLDSPNLRDTFHSKTMDVSEDTLESRRYKMKAEDQYDCLDKLSNLQEAISVVIYSPSDSSCGYLHYFEDLKEDTQTGESCIVYHFPVRNLRRVDQELPLDKIHNTFLKDAGKSYNLLQSGYNLDDYKLIDVIDKTKNQVTSGVLLSRIRVDVKLKSEDQVTVTLPDVKTLADCYRTCHNSEQLACNTFSFCSNGDCRVSSLLTDESFNESHVEQEKTCSIYASEVLNDYLEVPHRKFKTQITIAGEKRIDACAESCHASPDCLSFQWCDYHCSFGGFYTDAATEYDEECSVFLPKVFEKYQKTGNKIVSDVIHTEFNLNFEQCASLCHGWSDGETGCKSFNYCPKSKTESSCSLTEFSVKSSNTETTEGGHCVNYELKVESNGKKSSASTEITKRTSGSGAFGIIILFLFVGGLLGFAAPFGYTKVKQMRSASEANESSIWTRRVIENSDNIN
ncbi:uncharacterized protein LOC107369265 isoform X2 [Tetranychus urticae]|uniref:uncharacterized protein LOC107369265 isoform X2 n=1 Tax=Tetranychus urticae TaxID=32264 RepID=UPI00077BF15F|nr:uncharacterized protein LOC107369265 isoform X2 [Tetranychus urticae]